MEKSMFIKRMSERMAMKQLNQRQMTFTASGNSVVINDGKVIMTFPKGAISLHADESKTDSIEVRLTASRKNIFSFSYKELANPSATSVEDAINKLNNII